MNENQPRVKLSEMPLTCTACEHCPASGCQLRANPYNPELASFSRRLFVAGGAGAIGLAASGSNAIAQGTEATSGATAATCVTLTPEQTEGPYYIDDLLLRDDITEGKEGVPLNLEITVIDVATCKPVADTAVDIWHTDAVGDYSAFGGGAGQTWMRGVQLTDAEGVARIATIYPGWYRGRTIHIHIKVHLGGTAGDGTYIGGTMAHTGQLYFDDEVTAGVAQRNPYNQRLNVPRTLNTEDRILTSVIDGQGTFVNLAVEDETDPTRGFVGTVTLGIDQSAEQ